MAGRACHLAHQLLYIVGVRGKMLLVGHIDGILGGVISWGACPVLADGHKVLLDLCGEMVDGVPQLAFFRFEVAPVVDAAVVLQQGSVYFRA